jgi:hypothetical protein
MVVFCYMPGLYAADETLAERPGSATGIRLALHRGDIQPSAYVADSGLWARWAGERIDGSVDRAHLNWNAEARHGPVSPYFTVEDPAAEVLARYEEGGPVSCALKRRDGWTSVFLGAHVLEPQLWRALFREAGAHLYLETLHDDWQSPVVVEANERFLMIQAGRDGVRTVRLPRAYDEIRVLGGGGETVARGADAFAWAFTRHTPVCFQLGPWPD